MVFWATPALEQISPLPIFDTRITGYSLDQARLFLESLGPQGIDLYTNLLQKLDIPFPALLASSIGLALFILTPKRWGRWRIALLLLPLLGMICDYLENNLILIMLEAGPTHITENIVDWASKSTILKFQFNGIAVFALILLIGTSVYKKHSRKNK